MEFIDSRKSRLVYTLYFGLIILVSITDVVVISLLTTSHTIG
jgi:hypothetical protein